MDSELIVYAVKPQNVDKVNSEIWKAVQEGKVRENAMILSVAAGKPIENFVAGSGIERVARSMPNTPAQSKFLMVLQITLLIMLLWVRFLGDYLFRYKWNNILLWSDIFWQDTYYYW